MYDDGMKTNAEKPKRGRGRPSKGDDCRNVSATVKMSRNEYAAWKAMAAERSESFSNFLLRPLREKLKRKGRTP